MCRVSLSACSPTLARALRSVTREIHARKFLPKSLGSRYEGATYRHHRGATRNRVIVIWYASLGGAGGPGSVVAVDVGTSEADASFVSTCERCHC